MINRRQLVKMKKYEIDFVFENEIISNNMLNIDKMLKRRMAIINDKKIHNQRCQIYDLRTFGSAKMKEWLSEFLDNRRVIFLYKETLSLDNQLSKSIWKSSFLFENEQDMILFQFRWI